MNQWVDEIQFLELFEILGWWVVINQSLYIFLFKTVFTELVLWSIWSTNLCHLPGSLATVRVR